MHTAATASALLAVLLAGCMPAYIYGQTGTAAMPAKPADCGFEVLDRVPSRPYDELGVLAPPDIDHGSLAGGTASFVEVVRPQVCAAGGGAVVVEKDELGRIARGTVIKFK